MKSTSLAQIAIRTLALFLFYKAVEFGISAYVQGYLWLETKSVPVDAESHRLLGIARLMILVSSLIPAGLAGLLWMTAPQLARWTVPADEETPPAKLPQSLSSTLLQVTAIVFIGTAVATLPKLLYDFQNDSRRDPAVTIRTSKAFPDALLFMGKIIVGGVLLIVVKRGGLIATERRDSPAS